MFGHGSGRGRWRWAAAVVALGAATLSWPLGTGTSGAAAPPAPPPPAPADGGPEGVLPADRTWSVTLLTGDVVTVRSDADGRVVAGITDPTGPYRSYRTPDGEVRVEPMSMTPLLANVLDRDLFNVTGLVRQGFDDASSDRIPLIVQRAGGTDVARTLGAEGEHPLPSIGAVATGVAKADAAATGGLLAELADAADPEARAVAGITKVWLDRRTQVTSTAAPVAPAAPAQAEAAPAPHLTQIGADRAWADGLSGTGTTLAILDSGVDGTHPDLAGRVVAEENFSFAEDAVDRLGHGTHVASIAAGTGAASEGEHSGVAPGAQIISGKVVDDNGFGFMSEAIVGMEWAAPQADVVNMSLGYGLGSDGTDPVSLAVDALTAQHDALFVVAAGNSGPGGGSVEFPGAADAALTVGAVDGDDVVADFSSRGPLEDSYELKPEVAAPGVDVVAARAAEGVLGDPVDEDYVAMSGTSMAAPHAAGAAALLAQQHPDWTAGQLKTALVGTADAIDGSPYDRGAGRIDVGDAADAIARADVDVVDGALTWPRTAPHETPLSWTNTGTEPVTLALTAELVDRQGEPVDDIAVDPASLTIAPGATGTATVTVDGPALADGHHTGTVIADPEGGPDGDDLRTPIGLYAAPETVDLTIEATRPPGGLPSDTLIPPSFAAVVNLDDYSLFHEFTYFDDTVTVAVPKGTYAVLGDVGTGDEDAEAVAQVGDPEVEVDGPTTVTFDGAGAPVFTPTVPGVDTVPPLDAASYLLITPRAGADGGTLGFVTYSWDPMPTLRVTPMEGDPEEFSAFQIYRLQSDPHTATVRSGGTTHPVDVLPLRGTHLDTVRAPAFDGGDGQDLTGATGKVAVVRFPNDDPAAVGPITQRARAAGVAALVLVDEDRGFLTPQPRNFDWDLEVLLFSAAGADATRLIAAGQAGDRVVLQPLASREVYDIVSPERPEVDPEPVIDGEWRDSLATVRERFHRDPGGLGTFHDHRYPSSVDLMNIGSHGLVPGHRTAYLTPGVLWDSMADGRGWYRYPWEPEPTPYDRTAMAFDNGVEYEPGASATVEWLSRPMRPGPVGGPAALSACGPAPVQRTEGSVVVALAAFQDRRDGFTCGDPHSARMVLERDGVVVGETDYYAAEFPVEPGAGTFRLSYEQSGFDPYAHKSNSVWTFGSTGPGLLPLLIVDYDLPLDVHNRPTSRTAKFTVDQVTGAPDAAIAGLDVWTSVDGGATWQVAPAAPRRQGRFDVTLPRVAEGTAVSLRVDARDAAGSRLEQTLHGTYVG